jgi:hypothetical protein
MKEMIREFLMNKTIYDIQNYEKELYLQACYRLFKNQNPPENLYELAKLKLPRLIELLSNAPQHIIEQMIFSNKRGTIHETEI